MAAKPDKGEIIIVCLEMILAIMKNGKKLFNLFKKVKTNDTS